MCGRYSLDPGDYNQFYEEFDVSNRLERLEPRYNIAPGQMVPVVTRHSPNTIELMKWGLIPFWADDPRIAFKTINARSEGIENKPAFRKPLKHQRCLVPTSG